MKKLLRIETIKVMPYGVFQVLGILYLISFILSIIILPQIKLETSINEGSTDLLDLPSMFSFPVIWDTYAYLAAKSNIYLAILVIFLAGNEFSYLTFRQQVITGLSRSDLLNGKVLTIFAISLANMVVIFLAGILYGVIFTSGYSGWDMISHLPSLGIYFLQAVSYMLMALMLAVWLRNKTLAIVVLLVWSVILEPLIRLVLRKYIWVKIGLFFPVRVISRLSPFPENNLMDMIKQNANALTADFTQSLPLWANLLLAGGYGLLFYFIARKILLRRDL
ncbi:MAG: ABC transporter permease subunit [Bacteroidales bacterium]|nr:ABC transporter permease subunit [Bacteroidales bacterium]